MFRVTSDKHKKLKDEVGMARPKSIQTRFVVIITSTVDVLPYVYFIILLSLVLVTLFFQCAYRLGHAATCDVLCDHVSRYLTTTAYNYTSGKYKYSCLVSQYL